MPKRICVLNIITQKFLIFLIYNYVGCILPAFIFLKEIIRNQFNNTNGSFQIRKDKLVLFYNLRFRLLSRIVKHVIHIVFNEMVKNVEKRSLSVQIY